jgi:membrane protein required for colicin V production
LSNFSANAFDLAVLGVMLVSALLAFGRGLVRELLSIAAWVAAVLVAIWGFTHFKDFTRHYISIPILADMVTAVSIFLVTLIVCASISHALARNIRGSSFGALDRSLGLLFGLFRGAVLICFAYLLFTWAVPNEADQPDIVREARSRPLIASGADILRALLPQGALDKGAAAAADAGRQIEQQAGQQLMQNMGQPAPKPDAAPSQDPGYNAKQRKDMDRLIQGNQ